MGVQISLQILQLDQRRQFAARCCFNLAAIVWIGTATLDKSCRQRMRRCRNAKRAT